MTAEKRTTLRRASRFTITAEAMILDRSLSDRAVRIWMILDRRCAGREVTFPSRQMLADALPPNSDGTSVSLSSVDRAVRLLCEKGWLAKERADRGDVNAYVLLDGPVVTSDDTPPVVRDDDRSRHQGREASSPVTNKGETREEEKNYPPAPSEQSPQGGTERPARTRRAPAGERTPEFEEWYLAYPLHKAPQAAAKAYAKARRLTSHEALLEAAQRFRDDPTRDPAYTPHPATWLNAGRWEDEGPAKEQSTEVALRSDAGKVDKFAAARLRAIEAERRMAEMDKEDQ